MLHNIVGFGRKEKGRNIAVPPSLAVKGSGSSDQAALRFSRKPPIRLMASPMFSIELAYEIRR